jgi:hypothetical protein
MATALRKKRGRPSRHDLLVADVQRLKQEQDEEDKSNSSHGNISNSSKRRRMTSSGHSSGRSSRSGGSSSSGSSSGSSRSINSSSSSSSSSQTGSSTVDAKTTKHLQHRTVMKTILGWDGGNLRDERDYEPGFDKSKWFPFKSRGDAVVWFYFCAHSPSHAAFETILRMWQGNGEDRVTFVTTTGMIKYMRGALPLLEVHKHAVRNAVKTRRKGKKLHEDDPDYEYHQV